MARLSKPTTTTQAAPALVAARRRHAYGQPRWAAFNALTPVGT
jgi:hypothetical protein